MCYFVCYFQQVVVGEFDDRPLYEAEKDEKGGVYRKRYRGHSILDEEVTEHGDTETQF